MRRFPRASLIWDDQEERKLQIFNILCHLAKIRGVSIICVWRMKADYGEVDDLTLQSCSPIGNPDTCVFCGKSLHDEDAMKIGEFSCDGECYYETLVEVQGTRFFDPAEYRPLVILIDASVPGSLNNVVLGLAWGLSVFRRSLRRPGADITWVDTTAEDFALRLIGWIEKQLPPPEPIEYPGVDWVC